MEFLSPKGAITIRAILAHIICLSLVGSVGACSAERGSPRSDVTRATGTKDMAESDAVSLATWQYVDVGPGIPKPAFAIASVSGRLSISDGCIVLERADGSLIELVFYKGTAEFSEGALLTDDRRVEVGSRVEFAGRGRKNELILSDPSPRCPTLSRWYVSPQS